MACVVGKVNYTLKPSIMSREYLKNVEKAVNTVQVSY